MSLAKSFESALNLGALTEAWLRTIKPLLKTHPLQLGVKVKLNNSASVMAPGALVANVVRQSGISWSERPIRVLLLGSDPLIRFDKSKWASLAGDFLGAPGAVEILYTLDENADSEFSKLATALNLPACSSLTHEEVINNGSSKVDLAIWVHPAAESADEGEALNTSTAMALAVKQGVPVYSASFNEVDLHTQNFLIQHHAVKLQPIGGTIARGAPSINRYGISTFGLGVEGGWGAILAKVEPAQQLGDPGEAALVRTAMRLVCAEGALHTSWTLGQRINGVAFNRIIPLGLLGNMAIDPSTGHVFQKNEDSRDLRVIGHLWDSELKQMPSSKRELLLWACRIKLAFQTALPKEDARRKEAIASLEQGFNDGIVEAAVALARCYESSKADGSDVTASHWQSKAGARHPLSSYGLAYEALGAGDSAAVERYLRIAVAFGYPIAMTDLGKMLCGSEREDEGLALLNEAGSRKDPEANYELGELSAKGGDLQRALNFLRLAWTYGHAEAAALARQVADYMLQQGIGKRSLIKREAKEIAAFQKKLDSRLVANAS